MTDPIADMLTRIRNALLTGKTQVLIPYSKMKASIAQILVDFGYLESFAKQKPSTSFKHPQLALTLKYINQQPAINHLSRVSKPGRRVYTKAKKITSPLSGYGLSIISTSKGLMSHQQAQKQQLGGEVICTIW